MPRSLPRLIKRLPRALERERESYGARRPFEKKRKTIEGVHLSMSGYSRVVVAT